MEEVAATNGEEAELDGSECAAELAATDGLGPGEGQAQRRVVQSKARRRWRPWRRRLGALLAALLGPLLLRVLGHTWREEIIDGDNIEAARGPGGGFLLALWHGRMLVGVPYHRTFSMDVLVSPSGDGDISERLLQAFGYSIIRGSSSRGGARALREMLRAMEAGRVLVLTPDGPRGPQHSMNDGVAWLSRATGYAILPAGFVCDRAWRTRSWDRFTIPKPGARVALVYGEPLLVARGASADELAAASETLRLRIIEAERRGCAALGVEADA